MKNNLLLLGIFFFWTPFVFGQEAENMEFFCGTSIAPESGHVRGTEQPYFKNKNIKKRMAAHLGKSNGTVLYVPFKFKGEEDPEETDMNQVKEFFLRSSYTEYTLNTTITPVIELPFTRQKYIEDNLNWQSDLYNAVLALAFNPNDYDYYIKRSQNGQPFGRSVSYGHSINLNTDDVGTACHEIGHSLYPGIGFSDAILHHASLWQATNPTQVIGNGSKVEYGDLFSIMGSSNTPEKDIALVHKINLGWIKKEEYHYVTANDTYRIYAQDRGSKVAGRKYGIKVGKKAQILGDSYGYYYVEFVNNFDESVVHNGVLLRTFRGGGDNHTFLLITEPMSFAGALNAPLLVGKTFRDNQAGITIKTVAKGGSGDDAWMDVKVTFDDPNSTEQYPVLSVVTPTGNQNFPMGENIPVQVNVNQPGESGIFITDVTLKVIEPYSIQTAYLAPYNFVVKDLEEGTYTLEITVNNSVGLAVSKAITIHIKAVTSVKNFEQTETKIYPNPTFGSLNINCAGQKKMITYRLLTVTGKEIMSGTVGAEKIALSLAGVNAGIYFLQAYFGNGQRSVYKVIKQ